MTNQLSTPPSAGWAKLTIASVACLGAFFLGASTAGFENRTLLGLSILACSAMLFVYPTVALVRCKFRHAKIEAALRASEARFRNLADSLPQIVWITESGSAKATYLNNRWAEYTGLQDADNEINAKVIHPDDLSPMNARWLEASRTGNVFEAEFRMRPGESGPYLWFLARAVPVRNAAGEITEWFGTSTEIDALKQTEKALRQSQRHFRELAESMPQLVWTDLPDGFCDYLGPQWVAYTGVAAAEHLGFGWVDQIHPDDRAGAYAAWNRAVAEGKNLETEFRIQRADGVYRWFQTRAIPFRDETGAIIKWFGTNTDIEDIKRAERTLRESEARFHLTFDGMSEGCQIIGFDWRYLYMNESAARHGHRSTEDLLGRTMMEAYPGIDATVLFPSLMRCMLERTPHRVENRFDYPEGGTAHFELSIQPCPEGIFILSTEITDSRPQRIIPEERA